MITPVRSLGSVHEPSRIRAGNRCRRAARAYIPGGCPLDRPGGDPRRGQHLSRIVRRPDDRLGDSRRRGVDGGAAPVRRRTHPREQYRLDRRVRGLIDRHRRHLHDSGADHPGLLAGLPLFVGAGHRRPRRLARRAVLGAAAAFDDRRPGAGVPGRQGGGRSAAHRRESGAGRQAAGRFGHHRRPDETRGGQRPAADSRHGRHFGLDRQGPRIFRHQSFAGPVRHRLYRRAQYRHRDAGRRRDRLELRDSDLQRILPRRRAGAGGHGGRVQRDRCGLRHLVGADPLSRRRRDVDRRRLDPDLDAQVAVLGRAQRLGGAQREHGRPSAGERARRADELHPDRPGDVHPAAAGPVPDHRVQLGRRASR